MLKMLERFPIGDAAAGLRLRQRRRRCNVMAEAMRLAFADRAIWMGDEDFVPVPAKGLLDPAYVGRAARPSIPARASTPNPDRRRPAALRHDRGPTRGTRFAAAEPDQRPGDTTTHFSVVDKWGNMVSLHQHDRVRRTASACSPATRVPTAASGTTASCSTTS